MTVQRIVPSGAIGTSRRWSAANIQIELCTIVTLCTS